MYVVKVEEAGYATRRRFTRWSEACAYMRYVLRTGKDAVVSCKMEDA